MNREQIVADIMDGMSEFSRLRREKDEVRHKILGLMEQLRWIPASDGVPKEKGTEYLATIEYKTEEFGERRFVAEVFFGDKGWGIPNDQCIIAWMPMPRPYEDME